MDAAADVAMDAAVDVAMDAAMDAGGAVGAMDEHAAPSSGSAVSAPSGWRRALMGLAVGAAVGLVVGLLLPHEEHGSER